MKIEIKNSKYLAILVLFILLGEKLEAQVPWLANGNLAGGATGINASNNTLGTNGNFSINFKTNNTNRMIIMNGAAGGGVNGFIGMGQAIPVSADL